MSKLLALALSVLIVSTTANASGGLHIQTLKPDTYAQFDVEVKGKREGGYSSFDIQVPSHRKNNCALLRIGNGTLNSSGKEISVVSSYVTIGTAPTHSIGYVVQTGFEIVLWFDYLCGAESQRYEIYPSHIFEGGT